MMSSRILKILEMWKLIKELNFDFKERRGAMKEAEQELLQEAVQARCLPTQVSLFSIVMCSIYLYVEYNC